MSDQRVWWIDSGEDAGRFSEFHRATCEWVSDLGLDPSYLAPSAEVRERDGVFEFCAEQVVVDESGNPQRDPADVDSLLTTPVVVPVPANSWPARPSEVAS